MGLLTQRMALFDTLNSVPSQATYDLQLKSLSPNKGPNKSSIAGSIEGGYLSGSQSDHGTSFTYAHVVIIAYSHLYR